MEQVRETEGTLNTLKFNAKKTPYNCPKMINRFSNAVMPPKDVYGMANSAHPDHTAP